MMAVVQYSDAQQQVITKNYIIPKQVTKLSAWFKQARRTIPMIPNALLDVFGDSDWMISEQGASQQFVTFKLLHKSGQRAAVVIFRTKESSTI